MLNIPEAVKELFMADGIRKNFRITFEDKRRADITNENIISESVKFTESVCSEQKLKFGRFERSVLELDVVGVENIKGARIRAYYEIDATTLPASMQTIKSDVEFPIYQIPLGEFVVDKCPRTKADMERRKVTAYTPDIYDFVTGLGYEVYRAKSYTDSPYTTINLNNIYMCYFGKMNPLPSNYTEETVTPASEETPWRGIVRGEPFAYYPNKEDWIYYDDYCLEIIGGTGTRTAMPLGIGIFRISYDIDEQKDKAFDDLIKEIKEGGYNLEKGNFNQLNMVRQPYAYRNYPMSEYQHDAFPLESVENFAQYTFSTKRDPVFVSNEAKVILKQRRVYKDGEKEENTIFTRTLQTGITNVQITAFRRNVPITDEMCAIKTEEAGEANYKWAYPNFDVEQYCLDYGETIGAFYKINREKVTSWGTSQLIPRYYGRKQYEQVVVFEYSQEIYENLWIGETVGGNYTRGEYVKFIGSGEKETSAFIDNAVVDEVYSDYLWQIDGEIYDLKDNVVVNTLGDARSYELTQQVIRYPLTGNPSVKNFIAELESQLKKVTYTPIELTAKGLPFIEAGDRIKVTLPDGSEVLSYVLSRTLTGIQHLTDEITAEG